MGCQQQQQLDLTNLEFNTASPNPPSGNKLIVSHFTYNKTHLTMRYNLSADKPAQSTCIPLTDRQRDLLVRVLQGQHFYQHFYVQVKNKKDNLIWFALPHNHKEL